MGGNSGEIQSKGTITNEEIEIISQNKQADRVKVSGEEA